MHAGDMWALGALLFTALTGRSLPVNLALTPTSGVTQDELQRAVSYHLDEAFLEVPGGLLPSAPAQVCCMSIVTEGLL